MSPVDTAFLERVLEGDVRAVADMLAQKAVLVGCATDEEFGRGIPAGSTALHLAVRHGHGELVDALIAAGARLDARNGQGRTALHDALEFDHCMQARLIDAGATIDVCHAAFLDLTDRVRELVLENPDRANDRATGRSPLGWACYGNAAQTAAVLIDLGAEGDDGELLCAAQVGGVGAGRVLLDRGANVDALHRGFNALHAALTTPFTDDLAPFVALLLEYGADVNALTSAGQRPLDLLAYAGGMPASPQRASSLAACEALIRRSGSNRRPSETDGE